MVRLAPEDPERPVYLFQQEEPGHRMSKRHLREREAQVAPGEDGRRETEIPADNKSQLVLPGKFPFPEGPGELNT